jgi:hypothetical protein
MKRFLCALGLGIAVWALPGAGSLNAADIQSKTIAVPFAFKVERATLPAGHYRVEQNVGKPVIFLVNVQTGHRAPVMRANVDGPAANATLTFEKTREGYRLARIS